MAKKMTEEVLKNNKHLPAVPLPTSHGVTFVALVSGCQVQESTVHFPWLCMVLWPWLFLKQRHTDHSSSLFIKNSMKNQIFNTLTIQVVVLLAMTLMQQNWRKVSISLICYLLNNHQNCFITILRLIAFAIILYGTLPKMRYQVSGDLYLKQYL